jgi:hypothetical protein
VEEKLRRGESRRGAEGVQGEMKVRNKNLHHQTRGEGGRGCHEHLPEYFGCEFLGLTLKCIEMGKF